MRALLRQIVRFLMVGGLATVVHYAVLVLLVRAFSVEPVLASGSGFVISAALNYWLSHRYTFRSTRGHTTALPRFAMVATAGLAINQVVLGALVSLTAAHYLVAQVLATACVMAWNFVLGRMWTFGNFGRIR